jgi:hypothetical protein
MIRVRFLLRPPLFIMLKYKIEKIKQSYFAHYDNCGICNKKYKTGYSIVGISVPYHINWLQGYTCSERCANMWILQNI